MESLPPHPGFRAEGTLLSGSLQYRLPRRLYYRTSAMYPVGFRPQTFQLLSHHWSVTLEALRGR